MSRTFVRCLMLITLLLPHLYASAKEAPSRHALFIYLFIHDDVPQSRINSLRQDYFIWLAKDLESFTGRRVQLQFIRNVPNLTNFTYKTGDGDKMLIQWVKQLDRYIDERNLPRSRTSKYLLLTAGKLDETLLGLALERGLTGIASLDAYTAPAHEIGHMFGATHAAAKVLYRKGWWCETNMAAQRNRLLANCYVYSDENKKLISDYLHRFP